MRLLISLIFLLLSFVGFSQGQQPNWQPTQNNPVGYSLMWGTKDSVYMFSPKDTFNARYPSMVMRSDGTIYKTLGNGASWTALGGGGNPNDSTSPFYLKDTLFTHYDTLFWLKGTKTYYLRIDTFSTNPIVYGTTYGKYNAGDTAKWKGLSVRQAILDAITKCTHPTYVSPTTTVSASPTFGSYEYGTNLGTVTLSSTFTQNNGGTATGTTYYANGSVISGGNTFTISSLTSQQSASVTKAYGQGACINNNCGQSDCVGRINSGSVNSGNSYFTPFSYRYWGWSTSSTPNDAYIQTLNKDAGGLALTVTNTTPTGSQYFVYYHPTSSGSISNITVNGFPSNTAFTITTVSFTNAQGASTSYQRIISNNPLSTTTTFVFQ